MNRSPGPQRLPAVLLASLGVLAFTAPANAQEDQVKPRVMLLFDTSGSMLDSVCGGGVGGDNSAECRGSDLSCGNCNTLGCGNGLRDDSRLFKVKAGAYSVISAFGEVNFALSRFHQDPLSFRCSRGGWSGANAWCDNAAMGEDDNQADVLVSFADDNQQALLAWMNNCDDYPGAGDCPQGTDPRRHTPGSGCSLCDECGGGCDRELRGEGYTPISGSLYDLRTNFFPSVLAVDPKKDCRPYRVIVLTDGQNNCKGDPAHEANELYTYAEKSIPVHVIGFASASLQDKMDQIASGGGTGSAIIVDNEITLALAMASIISESILTESCNGIDDDCDDKCDESWPEVGVPDSCADARDPQTCTAGIGVCQRTGNYVCKADGTGSECEATPGDPVPGGEICGNALDDDCDGAVDEGCTPCVPQLEVCDGKDNDCDGEKDEGYVSVKCGLNVGECVQGDTVCNNGTVECVDAEGPQDEACDNKDNDCDGIVDNFSVPCYPYASGCNLTTEVCDGVCSIGRQLCEAGSFGECLGDVGPTDESCNGLDDDCDGQVDNGVANTCTNFSTCTTYSSCGDCPATPAEICDGKDNDCNGIKDDNPLQVGDACGTAVGECSKGSYICDAGVLKCDGATDADDEICDNKDNDCNGVPDDNVPGMGVACGTNTGLCKQGIKRCVGGEVLCVGEIAPTEEICDGEDNDCDGERDEGIPQVPCGNDEGECIAGLTDCVEGISLCTGGRGPDDEICDGKDNDCNGVEDDHPVDVGTPCGSDTGQCSKGTTQCVDSELICSGAVGEQEEVCDGKDNDCDGKTDNGIDGVGAPCGSDVGECTAGVIECQNTLSAGWALVCAGEHQATLEVCDNKDNDCDGETDETFPESGQPCSSNIGECTAGTYVCNHGTLTCSGGTTGVDEVCDGKDNDCDGVIDDNVPGLEEPCGVSDLGQCEKGVTKCIGGAYVCLGAVDPIEEICDGKDNNCDGQLDNEADCPGESVCIDGRCAVPCLDSEFACPGGMRCVDDYCVPDACAKITCADTEWCVEGGCVSRCANADCANHERCEPTSGRCIDNSCETKGCPDGQRCVAYKCVADPCPPGKCRGDQFCSDGECLDACFLVECPLDTVCVRGQCSSAPCDSFPCEDNHVCKVIDDEPTCQPDPCRIIHCPAGEVCHDGGCVEDPCDSARCPSFLTCVVTPSGEADCVESSRRSLPATTKVVAAGGGGLACSLTASPPTGRLLPLLLLLLLWRRRRS